MPTTPEDNPLRPSDWILEDRPDDLPTDRQPYAWQSKVVHIDLSRRPIRFRFGLLDLAALTATIAGLLALARLVPATPSLFGYFFGLCMLLGLMVFPAILLLVAACSIQAIRQDNRLAHPMITVAGWMILVGVAAWLVIPVIIVLFCLLFWSVRRGLQRVVHALYHPQKI